MTTQSYHTSNENKEKPTNNNLKNIKQEIQSKQVNEFFCDELSIIVSELKPTKQILKQYNQPSRKYMVLVILSHGLNYLKHTNARIQ